MRLFMLCNKNSSRLSATAMHFSPAHMHARIAADAQPIVEWILSLIIFTFLLFDFLPLFVDCAFYCQPLLLLLRSQCYSIDFMCYSIYFYLCGLRTLVA